MNSVSDSALVGGMLGAFFGLNLFLIISMCAIFYVLLVIAQWKIFTKAGEKGWKSLIPFYNIYVTFRIFWETKWFWMYLGSVLVASIVSSLVQNNTDVTSLLLLLLSLAVAIFGLIIWVMLSNRISKSFGHDIGYTIGLVFFTDIFLLILGFNKDKYKKIKG